MSSASSSWSFGNGTIIIWIDYYISIPFVLTVRTKEKKIRIYAHIKLALNDINATKRVKKLLCVQLMNRCEMIFSPPIGVQLIWLCEIFECPGGTVQWWKWYHLRLDFPFPAMQNTKLSEKWNCKSMSSLGEKSVSLTFSWKENIPGDPSFAGISFLDKFFVFVFVDFFWKRRRCARVNSEKYY